MVLTFFFNLGRKSCKPSQPVANLIDNESDRLMTLNSEKDELLWPKYCSVCTRDDGILSDCPQSVPSQIVCDTFDSVY